MRRTLCVLFVLLLLGSCIPYGDAWFRFGGTVRDASGQPIPDAVITITVNGRVQGVTRTDETGAYRFFEDSCPCDFAFRLTAEKDAFRPYVLELPGRQANRLTEHHIVLKSAA